MVLVVGATGLLGSEICLRLLKRGEPVRALVRSSSDPGKVNRLREAGAETVVGDLKEPASLAAACDGVDAVVSTASSTLSRAEGDSIQTVDHDGQLALVEAARRAGVRRFVFVSFPHTPAFPFPLAEAKAAVEAALADFDSTVVQPGYFMEVWLSPALGFDPVHRTARVYGDGTQPLSWVSYFDVAEICATVLRDGAAHGRTLQVGGPEALSPLEVIARFEKAGGGSGFTVEHVPTEQLMSRFTTATDPMEKSFAALMLSYAHGGAIEMAGLTKEFGLELTPVEAYARRVMAGGS